MALKRQIKPGSNGCITYMNSDLIFVGNELFNKSRDTDWSHHNQTDKSRWIKKPALLVIARIGHVIDKHFARNFTSRHKLTCNLTKFYGNAAPVSIR